MTLPDDDDAKEEATDALTPGVRGVEDTLQAPDEPSRWQAWYNKLKPLLGYLPTGTHESDTERDGLLSYSKENHAFILGLAIGMTFAARGDVQIMLALVDTALGVGRIQQEFSATVKRNIVKEPWYALSGAAIGYAIMHYDLLQGVGVV